MIISDIHCIIHYTISKNRSLMDGENLSTGIYGGNRFEDKGNFVIKTPNYLIKYSPTNSGILRKLISITYDNK